ncbi:hypothetical protein 16Q_068 [Pseudomonas phage 16Q]|nr:hypothetical protein 16Q_068 [Pseudomonas phage 16Q]
MKKKTKSRTSIILGFFVVLFLALDPLMMLWQSVIPAGSYAAIATFLAVIRSGLNYYMTTTASLEEDQQEAEEKGEEVKEDPIV